MPLSNAENKGPESGQNAEGFGRPARPRFWSDDFDMDLLKVFPETPTLLGGLVDLPVWTVGHETFGRLNHPVVWNSYGAFFWTKKPNLPRDKHGWFSISGHTADAPEIECTWLEFLRDAWPHQFGFMHLPSQQLFPGAPGRAFEEIMYNLRKWGTPRDVAQARRKSVEWIIRCHHLLMKVIGLGDNAILS